MNTSFRHIYVERQNEVVCVRLQKSRLEENEIREMSDEIVGLIDREQCRKLVMSLDSLDCLYSVLIAKLILIRRQLLQAGGGFKLCDASPQTMSVFESCQLGHFFDFEPDQPSAIASFTRLA